MTDRELLELAAKAAGHKLVFDYDANLQGPCIIDSEGFPEQWNPLEDDGDALRLAVKLGFIVGTPNKQGSQASAQIVGVIVAQDSNIDAYIATRRAIVRAAAELSKSLTTGANHD